MDVTTTVRRSDSLAALSGALASAQGEMTNPTKDSVNPHFKSKYADLATVRDAVIPALSKYGLAVLQLPCEAGSAPALTTLLLHKSGEWIETTLALRAQQNTPQGVGSALTYCRRYALQSIAGVAADEDDDGNASAPPKQQRPAPKQQRPAPKPEYPVPVKQPAVEKPAPKNDGIDRTADDATRAARDAKLGDPMNDSAAILALSRRKGWQWADLIKSINDRFKSAYSITRTPWRDIAEGHRKATIEVLNKSPDKDSAGDLTNLVKRVAVATNEEPAAAFQRYQVAAKLPEACIKPEDLNAEQLATACKAFRAKLDSLAGIADGDEGNGE